MHVTVFADKGGSRINAARQMSFEEIERVIRNAPAKPEKEDLPLLKLATFGETRTEKGCLRNDANVVDVSGIEGDYDGEHVSIQHAAKVLSSAGLGAVLYTSSSHAPEKPHWRVTVGLSRPLEGDTAELQLQRRHWCGVLNALLGGILTPESFTLSQSYFFGPIIGKPDPEIIRLSGCCLDELEEIPTPVYPSKETSTTHENGSSSHYDSTTDADLRAVIGCNDEVAQRLGLSRYEAMLKWSSRLAMLGAAADDIEAALLGALGEEPAAFKSNGQDPRSAAKGVAESAVAKFGETRRQATTIKTDNVGFNSDIPPDPESIPLEAYGDERVATNELKSRVIIQLEAGRFHVTAEAAERLIAGDMYVRARQLARIGKAPELSASLRADITRDQEQRVIVPVTAEYLKRRLNTLAEFRKYSKREKKWFPVDCPSDLVYNILGYGDWQHFRPLEGIATAPFLRPDLTVCSTPGYDAASRVYYAPTEQYPPLPENPNWDDAQRALERLLDPFTDFPFATQEARAAFLSHILTATARHAIDTRPIYTYTAPIAATGKTLLASMASRIADGIVPAVRPYSDESEEMRKVLMSSLLAGDSTLLFDNVPSGSKVRSAILCGFVTATIYTDRKLGVSESPSLPNRCQVILTGNNVAPTGDLARRCLVVRLDVNAETARGREFRMPDLKAHVRSIRTSLLVDALTVIRAYALANDPVMLRPLESFERWSRIVRDPIVWLGYGDAVQTQQVETDDELAPLVAAFQTLTSRQPFAYPAQFTASHISVECGTFAGEELRQVIQAAGCSDATNARNVGYWLREHRDKIAGGLKLVSLGITHGSARWQFKSLGVGW